MQDCAAPRRPLSLFLTGFAQLGMAYTLHGVLTHAAFITELEDLTHPVTVFVCAIRRAREENEIVCCSHIFRSYICRPRAIRSVLKTQVSSSEAMTSLRQSDEASADSIVNFGRGWRRTLSRRLEYLRMGSGRRRATARWYLIAIWRWVACGPTYRCRSSRSSIP